MLGLRGRGNNSLLCQCSSLCEILPQGPITNNSLNCYLLNQTNLCCNYNFTRFAADWLFGGVFQHYCYGWSDSITYRMNTRWMSFQHFAMVGVTLSLIEVTLCGPIRKSSHSVSFQQLPKFAEVSHKLPRMTKTCQKSYHTLHCVSCDLGLRKVHSDFRMKQKIKNEYKT